DAQKLVKGAGSFDPGVLVKHLISLRSWMHYSHNVYYGKYLMVTPELRRAVYVAPEQCRRSRPIARPPPRPPASTRRQRPWLGLFDRRLWAIPANARREAM